MDEMATERYPAPYDKPNSASLTVGPDESVVFTAIAKTRAKEKNGSTVIDLEKGQRVYTEGPLRELSI